MDKFKTVLNIAGKQTNLGFGLIALLTAGGEQIFSAVVFKCPCNELNFVYGIVFLLVPALALLLHYYRHQISRHIINIFQPSRITALNTH